MACASSDDWRMKSDEIPLTIWIHLSQMIHTFLVFLFVSSLNELDGIFVILTRTLLISAIFFIITWNVVSRPARFQNKNNDYFAIGSNFFIKFGVFHETQLYCCLLALQVRKYVQYVLPFWASGNCCVSRTTLYVVCDSVCVSNGIWYKRSNELSAAHGRASINVLPPGGSFPIEFPNI